MENNKEYLLTIAIPTYNRARYLKTSLTKLLAQLNTVSLPVELIVSDNASTDNTEDVVKEFIDKGNTINYIRNSTNLGMDGNFIQCFRKAKGKYVWVLGDDDYLVDDGLKIILESLNVNTNYGLVHLSHNLRRTEVFTKANKFVSEISFWITFISANIVNTNYVKEIDFEKYMGTFFTLIPLYFTAVANEKYNLMIGEYILDGGKDIKRNGGYNYFEVFTKNYLSIWKEYKHTLKISNISYEKEKKNLFKYHITYFFIQIKILKLYPNFKTNNAWSYLFHYYWYEWYFYKFILSLPFIPIKLKIKQILGSNK